jgi:hypothetical protein
VIFSGCSVTSVACAIPRVVVQITQSIFFILLKIIGMMIGFVITFVRVADDMMMDIFV